ncbi:hypothetical protein OK074_4660 [Actinobacteria bacterium OK074]|nr:hypothetical protein OK074_4660 [Actinobacteria bacterium OK074]
MVSRVSRSVRTRAKRLWPLVLAFLLGAGLLVGCDSGSRSDDGQDPSSSPRQQAQRARQVAVAWRESAAVAAWRSGYHPVADAIRVPASGWHSKADERAYATRNFVLRGGLPADYNARRGKVIWGSGGSVARPLWGVGKAYRSFALNRSAGARLTVTGARLGETTIATSRGTATVPAWLFTLEGYDSPLARVAVSPSPLPAQPIAAVREGSAGGLRRVGGLVGTPDGGRAAVTVMASHGACDDGPVVRALETDASVVLYASVSGARSGPCNASMSARPVKVALRKPLGDRVLLDALTGRPVLA